MTSVAEEIDSYRKELQEIVGRGADDNILKGLLELAPKVGACIRTPRSGGFIKEQIDDLVQSINHALQTWAMIDASRTAAKNHKTAMIAAIIAAVAAVAAWAAVVANSVGNGGNELGGISISSAANSRNWITVFLSIGALVVSIVAVMLAARRLWYHAMTELMRDYSQPDMAESVNRLWEFWRQECKKNKDEVEKKFRALCEHVEGCEFLRLNKGRRQVSHFYQRMAGLYTMHMLPRCHLYLHWRESDLRIIPEILIPMEKALKESRGEKLADEFEHLSLLYSDSCAYEKLTAFMGRHWSLRAFPGIACKPWSLYHRLRPQSWNRQVRRVR